MTTIITRSALVFHGHNPPPDVARVEIDPRYGRTIVTWSDVMAERRRRQELNLERKRACERWRPYKLWVAYYDMDLFGGWHAFLENRCERVWIDRDRPHLKPVIVQLFPLVLAFDDCHQWERWKIAFAEQYCRGSHDRKPRGMAIVRWNGIDKPRRHA